MLNDLLWIYGFKRNYDTGKETGLAGLIGLAVTALLLWKWEDVFYPLLQTLGVINFLTQAGLIDEGNMVQTVINVIGMGVACSFIIGLAMAIPSTILMVLFLIGGAADKPNPIKYAIAMLFLPLGIIFLGLYKLLAALKIVSPLERTIHHYVKGNEQMKAAFKSPKTKEQLLELLAIQEGDVMKHVSQEDARTLLNKAYGTLEKNTDYLFGYSRQHDSWHVLLPTPIPAHASACLMDKKAEESPLNYKPLQLQYIGYVTGTPYTEPPKFYVPSLPVIIEYNAAHDQLMIQLRNDVIATVACVDDLELYEMQGAVSAGFYQAQVKTDHRLQKLVEKAHIFSYLIPLATYEEEVTLYQNNIPFSYYAALQKVPNTTKFAEQFKDLVHQTVLERARSGYFWAINLKNDMKY